MVVGVAGIRGRVTSYEQISAASSHLPISTRGTAKKETCDQAEGHR